MRSPEEIVQLWHQLERERASWANEAKRVLEMYDGRMAVPLPELDEDEKPAAVNLLGPGLDQYAMRIGSVLPDMSWPALRVGFKNSTDLARSRRRAMRAIWEMNDMKLRIRARARHLLGYGVSAVTLSPVSLSPFDHREIPHWRVRDPLDVYCAPTSDSLDFEPEYAIVVHRQTLAWLRLTYPESYRTLRKGRHKDNPAARVDLLEYHDHEQAGTLVVVGSADAVPRWEPGNTVGEVDGSAPFLMLGEPVVNRAGIPLVVMPGRICLGDTHGMFNGLIGKYLRAAKLDALQTIAVQRGVFADEWVVSHPNTPGRAKIVKAADGRLGIRGEIQNGTIQTIQPQPGPQTDLAIDRLERAERLEALIPEELGGECVDVETEILTADGWRRYDHVSVGDEVLTLNHETGESEWQIVQKMNVYRRMRREMVEMEGTRFSALTTANHRWPVMHPVDHGTHYTMDRAWVTSDKLAARDRIPTCAPNAHLPTEQKYSTDLVELVAWYWTEGTRGRDRNHELAMDVSIAQSARAHPENVDRIRSVLMSLFGAPSIGFPRQGHGPDGILRWREREPNARGVVNFVLNAAASRVLAEHAPGAEKVVARSFLRALTMEQLERFIEVSMLADNGGGGVFGQSSAARADAFAFACILSGRAVSYGLRERVEDRPGFRAGPFITHIVRMKTGVVAKPIEAMRRGSTTVRRVLYDGVVWCPTTPNHTWFARRHGKTYFTGNSGTNIRTARRGSTLLGSAIDMPIQEAQEILAVSLEAENRRAVAMLKSHWGGKTTSFYVGRDGKTLKGADTYMPNEVFETDWHSVKYAIPGTDSNGLIISLGQQLGLGALSIETFMRMAHVVDDVDEEQSLVVRDGVRKALLASIEQGAASGQIPTNVAARILQKLQDPTETIEDAIAEVHKEMQAEQQAAQQAQQAAQPPGPEAQPGIGAGPPQPPQPAIGPPAPSSQNLAAILSSLRSPQAQSPGELANR